MNDAFYVFFATATVVPLWFLLHSMLRVILHYRDGRQAIGGRKPKLYYIKRVCVLLLACISLFDALDEVSTELNLVEIIVKCAFFGVYSVAWITSFVMLRFEFERGLRISWKGHKGYWVESFGAFITCAVFQTFLIWGSHDFTMAWIRISVYLISGLLCFFLTCCALFKPNDFAPSSGVWTGAFSSLLSPLPPSTIGSIEEIPDIGIQIENFKKKMINGRSVDLYEIIVTVRAVSTVIWKSYIDFDVLHRQIREKYNGEFPILALPQLPEFSVADTIDFRMQCLKRYLEELNFPAFYCEELLDFLKLQDDVREVLLKEHFKITGSVRDFPEVTMSHSGSILVPDHKRTIGVKGWLFEVCIVDWRQAESKDGHIEYDIHWKLSSDLLPNLPPHYREGRIVRRFNEFYVFHKCLKQELAPARLPDFPSKTYLSRLIRGIDKEAVEYRRRALELYLRACLNDPAYLAPRLLDFIECRKFTYTDIFDSHKPVRNDVRLAGPVGWEYELGDNNEQFILYLLHFEQASRHWVVRRRYREFDSLHRRLVTRANSPLLAHFVSMKTEGSLVMKLEDFPMLPKKALQLTSRHDIETRRKGLESYLSSLLQLPFILESFAFCQFIEHCD